ncbi:hypothetical protein N9A19_04740, partial [Porticoccaceae bacterium]|nr:hypothetical protein [Porticoccaceae bacterium]
AEAIINDKLTNTRASIALNDLIALLVNLDINEFIFFMISFNLNYSYEVTGITQLFYILTY